MSRSITKRETLLERFDRLQWVNEGFYRGYGWKGQVPLLDPTRLAQLANPAASAAAARQAIFARFRDPAYHTLQEDAWPRVYGDSFDQPPHYPQQYLAVTREQYRRLAAWAQGHFTGDWHGAPPASPARIEDLPLAARPAALDEAALAACSGGPFHPGAEATWPLGGEGPGDGAAPVVAGDMAAREAERVLQARDVARQDGEVVGTALAGQIVAALVGHDDAVAGPRRGRGFADATSTRTRGSRAAR